jgi:tetratricopeptide (TPR) repeat protein
LFRQGISLLEYGPLNYPAFSLEPLARAFFVSGDLENAEKEYERISRLIAPGLSGWDIYAKSFYMLGRIYEQQGETGRAIEHYDRFLDLWKDADPGQIEVEEAKTRVAALRQ